MKTPMLQAISNIDELSNNKNFTITIGLVCKILTELLPLETELLKNHSEYIELFGDISITDASNKFIKQLAS